MSKGDKNKSAGQVPDDTPIIERTTRIEAALREAEAVLDKTERTLTGGDDPPGDESKLDSVGIVPALSRTERTADRLRSVAYRLAKIIGAET